MDILKEKLAIIDKLDHAISECDSLKSVAKTGLGGILELFNRNNGCIYIPKNIKKWQPIWIVSQPLDSWVDETMGISSLLLFEMVNFIEGKSREKKWYTGSNFQLLPLYWQNEIQALIVLDSQELTDEEKKILPIVSNSIAKEIFLRQSQLTTISSEQYLTTLRIISVTQSSELNLNDVQLWILKV
jgi:hypothetical protein